MLEKVTAFITRGREVLLLEHPYAGIQFPAGTVEEGERPEHAVLREGAEESGLSDLALVSLIGQRDDPLTAGEGVIVRPTLVYAHPDPMSLHWVHMPRGVWVKREGRQANGFTQITYHEVNRQADPPSVSYQITGWVPDGTLANRQLRYFFHLSYQGESSPRWPVEIDDHQFILFWAPLATLPPIIFPQNTWLPFLKQRFPDVQLQDATK